MANNKSYSWLRLMNLNEPEECRSPVGATSLPESSPRIGLQVGMWAKEFRSGTFRLLSVQ